MTTSSLQAAFEFGVITLCDEDLLPTRVINQKIKESAKYRALFSSIKEVGVIEPVSVYPHSNGKYIILDGHARVAALREHNIVDIPCLVATQDDSYTYNKRVNRISPIQANRMIMRALDAGVSVDRIAKTLGVAIHTVQNHRNFLNDICPEVISLLHDKHIAQRTILQLKRVKPLRQIEMAEIMVAAGVYSEPYARALVMTTSKEQLVRPESQKKVPGIKSEDLARIEHEMRVQEKDFLMLDETYNKQVMALTIARGYLRSLLENNRVIRFLAQSYPEFLTEFQRIVESNALDG